MAEAVAGCNCPQSVLRALDNAVRSGAPERRQSSEDSAGIRTRRKRRRRALVGAVSVRDPIEVFALADSHIGFLAASLLSLCATFDRCGAHLGNIGGILAVVR